MLGSDGDARFDELVDDGRKKLRLARIHGGSIALFTWECQERMYSWYTPIMTTADVIKHWRKGAAEALDAAKLLANDGKYDLALFHCHLAVEKKMKAAVMEETGKPHPKVHNLSRLAQLIREDWPENDRELFTTLSEFSVAARYDDPAWSDRYATEKNARLWIDRAGSFLSKII